MSIIFNLSRFAFILEFTISSQSKVVFTRCTRPSRLESFGYEVCLIDATNERICMVCHSTLSYPTFNTFSNRRIWFQFIEYGQFIVTSQIHYAINHHFTNFFARGIDKLGKTWCICFEIIIYCMQSKNKAIRKSELFVEFTTTTF